MSISSKVVTSLALCLFTAPLFALAACSNADESVGKTIQPLTAVCVEPGAAPPAGAFTCGGTKTVECSSFDGAGVDQIFVPSSSPCADTTQQVSNPGPFPVGTTQVTVTTQASDGGAAASCAATIHVVDTTPPTIEPKATTSLWPPNHTLHHVDLADCASVVDTCDPKVRIAITYVESDEPANATGDGNTAADIVNLSCTGVDLRAERSGNKDGRVYTIGVRATDAAGNHADGACHVAVSHDQGNGVVAVGGPAAVHVAAPACP